MNLTKLTAAIAEAERFIRRAEALRDKHLLGTNGGRYAGAPNTIDRYPLEQGAAKRSSMDLTRALADLRKPNN